MAAFIRIIVIIALLAALLPTAADARHRHHRHRDGFDVGDAIVGAVILGGVLAIANASKKKREERDRRDREDSYPPGDWPEGDWERGDWERDRGWYPDRDRRGDDNRDWDYGDARQGTTGTYGREGAAVDTCVREAEDLAGRYGADARIVRVGDPQAEGAETRVSGLIEITDRRDENYGQTTNSEWICYVRADGRISSFRFLSA